MSSQRARDEFFHYCGFHGLGSWHAAKILRRAADVQRAAEVECSFSDPELRAYWEKRGRAAATAILGIVAHANEHEIGRKKWRVEFQGDPRGNCVKLIGRTKPGGVGTFAHEGSEFAPYGVPARAFTATEFARLERVNEARQAVVR